MLTLEKLEKLRSELDDLLNDLREGKHKALEYGCLDLPYINHLRIFYIHTAGGMQYGLSSLEFGASGSLIYTPDAPTVAAAAMNLVNRYHKPLTPGSLIPSSEVAVFNWYPTIPVSAEF